MKRLLVSDVNTSVRTDSCVGSVRRATSTVMSSEIPTAMQASATNVRVVRSLISSACRSALTSPPP